MFECDFDEDANGDNYKIGWRLLDSDDEEVDTSSRAWIRGGGRYVLLLEITDNDGGKAVECRVYRSNNPSNVMSIGFAVISEDRYHEYTTERSDGTDSWTSRSTMPPMTNAEENLFMTLSVVFAVLWIITITLPVVWYKCTKRKTREDNSAQTYSTVIYKDTRVPAPFPAGSSAGDTKDATYYHTIKGGAVDIDEDGYLILTGDMGGGVLGDKGREAGGSKKCQGRDVDEDEDEDGYLVVLQDSRDGNHGNGGRDDQGEVKCNEYMEMSGSQGQVEYEWMKSLTYELY